MKGTRGDQTRKSPPRGPSRGVSRRDLLKTIAATGTAAVVGRDAAASPPALSGWPESWGMLTDLTECVGCRSCEEACNRANRLPPPAVPFDEKAVFETKRRPTARAYTVVNRYENPASSSKPIYRKVQCNHCNEPACASACPVRAYRKTPEGAVLYDKDVCFGCRYCMVACPFGVPAFDYESALDPRIVKCTMCYERVKAGGIPACAQACPVGAITFGKRSELLVLARRKMDLHPGRYVGRIFGEREAGGTGWVYLAGVPFGTLDFPENLPDRPLIENTKGFLSAVPLVLVIWPALLGMCYSATRNNREDRE